MFFKCNFKENKKPLTDAESYWQKAIFTYKVHSHHTEINKYRNAKHNQKI